MDSALRLRGVSPASTGGAPFLASDYSAHSQALPPLPRAAVPVDGETAAAVVAQPVQRAASRRAAAAAATEQVDRLQADWRAQRRPAHYE